ncbi:hypothetical protein HDV57DRAFT_509936 [Trichoderma longibrachiatum]
MLAVPVRLEQAASARPRDASSRAAICSSIPEDCSEALAGDANKRKADGEHLHCPERLHKKPKCGGEASRPQPASLAALPIDIHHHVFDLLQKLKDVVNLGLVNRDFFMLAQVHVHNRIARRFGRWADQSIICVGANTKPDDCPPSLIPGSLKECPVWMQSSDEPPVEQEGPGSAPELSLADLARSCPSAPPLCTTAETRRMGEKLCRQLGVSRATMQELGVPFCTEDWDQYFPPEETWILRNLRTREYVREEATVLTPDYLDGAAIGRLGFGEAVLSRIFWASVSIGVAGPRNWVRGPWAGHRFDITTLTRHREEMGDGTDWRDVSDEVAEWRDKAYECEFGRDWREWYLERER